YDKLAVGVREARAWLRGRYPALAPSTLDSILRLFSPDLGPTDVLTGGQFFAALRLVSHVLGGKEMDPSLVFIQAMGNGKFPTFIKCAGPVLHHRASAAVVPSPPPSLV
ncbi:hypothetical protein OH76DRAFT_1424321, partial [Lentinus brumalis]